MVYSVDEDRAAGRLTSRVRNWVATRSSAAWIRWLTFGRPDLPPVDVPIESKSPGSTETSAGPTVTVSKIASPPGSLTGLLSG